MRNSSFQTNRAELDTGGVIYVGQFATAIVEGTGNLFELNTCGSNGAVFAATANSSLIVEGGEFNNNSAEVRDIRSPMEAYVF